MTPRSFLTAAMAAALVSLHGLCQAQDASAPSAEAIPKWDGYALISAVRTADGKWASCSVGELVVVSGDECSWTNSLHKKMPSKPFLGTLQETLDHRVESPSGKHAVAMGPLPYAYLVQDRIGSHYIVAKDRINIAYRLVPVDATAKR